MRIFSLLISCLTLLACGSSTSREGKEPKDNADAAVSTSDSAMSTETEVWIADEYATLLAADETDLYYVSSRGIERVGLESGSKELFVPVEFMQGNRFVFVRSLALSPTHVVYEIEDEDLDTSITTSKLMITVKSAFAPLELTSSTDPRAFVGITADSTQVYYSIFDSLFRVAQSGGENIYMGETEGYVHYWVTSPTRIDEFVYWIDDAGIWVIRADARASEAASVLELGPSFGPRTLLEANGKLFYWETNQLDNKTHVYEVDPVAKTTTPRAVFSGFATDVAVRGDATWAALFEGVLRSSDGSEPETVLAEQAKYVDIAPDGTVYVSTASGIHRFN